MLKLNLGDKLMAGIPRQPEGNPIDNLNEGEETATHAQTHESTNL